MVELAAIYIWIGLIILVVCAGIEHDAFSTETKIFIVLLWPVFLVLTYVLSERRKHDEET
jgi:cell division protein FtsW (lipid II flippase)